MRLLEIVTRDSASKVERELRELANKSGDQLSAELTARDSNERTPLYLAVEKGDLEMVKVLLSFDVSIDAKVGHQTVEEYAKQLAESKHEDQEKQRRKRVYALIKSRGRWQSAAAKTQGILFSRSMKAIEDAVTKINGAEGQVGVLFLGITGEGKSTFINYLSGVDYKSERVQGKRRVKATSPEKEIASVGGSTTSETSLPQVVKSNGGNHVLIDLPGFEDTRGTAEEICAAASICMLTKKLKSIQAVLLIVSWGSLEDPRMNNYRKAAHNIGAMISVNHEVAKNVVLIVTKPDGDLTKEDVQARLKELVNNEGFAQSPNNSNDSKENKREDISDDVWKKQCLRRTTEAILKNDNILLANVTSEKTRSEFESQLNKLAQDAKKSDQFDFNGYSRYMTQFVLVIEHMIKNYNHLVRERQTQDDKISRLNETVRQSKENQVKLMQSVEEWKQKKTKPFTEKSFDEAIQQEKQKLASARTRLLEHNKKLADAQLQASIKSGLISGVEREGERIIDTVNRGWVCEKTQDRVETKVNKTGRRVFVPEFGGLAEIVDIQEEHIAGKETTVSEPVKYPSSVPIRRYVDKSQGGKFVANGFTPGAMELNGIFHSSPGAHGGVFMAVELYGDIKDFPGTKDKIDRLEQDAKRADNELKALQRETISEKEVQAADDKIREMELEKIRAVGNQERTQALCDMQINFLLPQIEAEKNKLTELELQMSKEQEISKDLSLQCEVNAELFDRIREIVQIMGFQSGVIDQFMSLYKRLQSAPVNDSKIALFNKHENARPSNPESNDKKDTEGAILALSKR